MTRSFCWDSDNVMHSPVRSEEVDHEIFIIKKKSLTTAQIQLWREKVFQNRQRFLKFSNNTQKRINCKND